MATNYDRTVFVNGAEPAINAENLNKITAFCDAIASGGAGSVVSADLALNSNNLSGKGLDAATSTTPDKIPLRDANGTVRNPAVNPNNGLVFAGSPTLPEYPDNAAGTLVRYGVGSITSWTGWTTTRANATVQNGIATIVATDTNPRYTQPSGVSGQNGKSVRLKISTTTPALITGNAVLQLSLSPFTTQINFKTALLANPSGIIVDAVISDTTPVDRLMISIDGPIGLTFSVEFIYIGDGTYSSRLLDASGNGNRGTVFGCTPTADGGLSFDGVNDYVELANTIPPTGDFTLHLDVNMITNPTTEGVIFDSRPSSFASGGAGVLIGLNTSGVLRTAIGIGATNVNIISGNPTIGGAGRQMISVAFNRTAGLMLTYNNGILVNTTSIAAVIGSIFANTIMRYFRPGYTTSSPTFAQGTIRQPRIYNRTLTEAEITALATNPDAYNLDRVTRSVTPVPGSVVTRGPAGIIRLATSTPASATAPGEVGQFAYDSGFLYICTATNTWKRIGVAAW